MINKKGWIAISLLVMFWINLAQAASVPIIGETVKYEGSTQSVGLLDSEGRTVYYIPLNSGNGYTGVYGDTSMMGACVGGRGTCSDSGNGAGYSGATALAMNIYFDLTGLDLITSATLDFVFDDLDLIGTNDPKYFFESMSLSYLDTNTPSLVNLNPLIALNPGPLVIQSPGDMSGTVIVSGAAKDPILWSLDLAAILGDLNDSRMNNAGFWIQLGFGSDYKWTGTNTPEYLTSSLTVSAVPIPAAIWLFGTAILGLVGVSRRRKAA